MLSEAAIREAGFSVVEASLQGTSTADKMIQLKSCHSDPEQKRMGRNLLLYLRKACIAVGEHGFSRAISCQ